MMYIPNSAISTQANNNTSYFCITAEENADLNTNTFEWAYGNGANTGINSGVIIPFNATLKFLTLSISGTASVEVAALKNGVQVASVTLTTASSGYISTNVQYFSGDFVNFRTVLGSTASNSGVVTAWFSPSV